MSTTELQEAGAVQVPLPAAAPPAEGAWLKPPIAWYAVSMVALVTVFGQLDNGVMTLLVSAIKHDTHMSDVQVSLLIGAAASVIYMLCGLPMARVADVGRRSLILPVALVVWSIGTIGCGLAQNFWQFFLARGIVGGGVSVKGPCSVALIPDLVPRAKLSRAFAVYNMAVSGGQYLSMILGGLLLGWLVKHPPHLPWLGAVHPWQMVFFLLGLPGVIVGVVFMLTVPEPARHGRTRPGSVPIMHLLRFLVKGPASKVLAPLIIGAAINNIYFFGVSGWRQAFVQRTYGVPAHVYGPVSGTVGLLLVPLGVFLAAFLAERMARRWDDANMRLVVITHVLMLPLGILAPLMPSFPLSLALQASQGVLIMISAPASLAAMQIVTPNEMRGQVNAVYMFTVSVLGTGLGPTVVALLTQYLFHAESSLRYAMVTAAAVASPIVLFCQWKAMKPYGLLHRQVIEAERG